MNSIGRFTATLAMLLGLAGTSHASSVFAAPATAPYGIWLFETTYCTVLNTRTVPLEVTVRTHQYNGAVVQDTGPIQLQPEAGSSLSMDPGASYCEFEVSGSSKSVRGMAVSRSAASGHYTIATPAE